MNGRAETILGPLRANADRHPEKLLYAFLDRDGRTSESYSYAAFIQRSVDIASHIVQVHPLDPGERVLLLYPPGLEMLCGFFACVRLGLIPVPAYPPSHHGFAAAAQRMSYIARDCGAAAVLTERSYYWSMRFQRVRTNLSALSFKGDYTSRLQWIVTTDAEPNTRPPPREAHSEILFLQYTSGSTRRPRGVIVTHDSLLDNCDITIDHAPVGVSWLPQYHDLGLIGAYLFLALKGGTTWGFSPMDFMQRPVLWLETISRCRATMSAAPNFAYGYCLRPDKVSDETLDPLDLASLDVLMSGAEPVRAEVFRGFLDRFGRCGLKPRTLVAAYGLAEFTLAVSSGGRTIRSFDASRLAERKVCPVAETTPVSRTTDLVSCGPPLGTTEVRIVDVTGTPREAAPGHLGEVWVRGPSKGRGYWNRPELSEEVFEARIEGLDAGGTGWLRTGDLGFLLEGELFICGRTKDLIIVRGVNYFPADIEAIVEEDPAIRTGCVAAFMIERGGLERLVVIAELKGARRRPDTVSINRGIRTRLGVVADCFAYISPRTIPKTSSGKIMRNEARTRWEAGDLDVLLHVDVAPVPGTMPGDSDEAEATEGLLSRDAPVGSLEGIGRRYRLSGTERVTLGEAGLDSLAIAGFAGDLQDYLEAQGAGDLAAAVDVRWLQQIAIRELFGLLRQLASAAPDARRRFRQAFATLQLERRNAERSMMRRDARLGFDAATLVSASARTRSTRGGTLLTGGTGFFGPFLLQSLLEQTDDDIYALVRAEDGAHGRDRLRKGLSSLGVGLCTGSLAGWEDRVIPIRGDLSRPHLGTSAERWRFLAERIHTIYHNGARVNYLADYASMRDVNVGGTNEVVRLALTHRVKVLNHISSTFVFGWSIEPTLFETDHNQNMALLDFGYSQSKWVSEQIVLDGMRQGLPARVFRPALITPSVIGGGRNFDIAIRLLAFMIKHGMTTTARNQVSFAPADVVANNVVAISNLPGTVGQTYHATRDRHSSMLHVTELLGRMLAQPFAAYPLDEFVPRVIERCGKDDLLFPLLNFLVRSVDSITAMEFKRYCNRNYRAARDRSPVGKEDPPLEDVVLGIVRFMRKHAIVAGATETASSNKPPGGTDNARL